MQHLENDMDDLFQRAAENYPLKNNADWESVAKKMEAEGKFNVPDVPEKNKKDKKIIVLLLLLIIISAGWFTWYIFTTNSGGNKNVEIAKEKPNSQGNLIHSNNVAPILPERKASHFTLSRNKNIQNKHIVSSSVNSTTFAGNAASDFINKTSDKSILQNNSVDGSNNNDAGFSSDKNFKQTSGNDSSGKKENTVEETSQQPGNEKTGVTQQKQKVLSTDKKSNDKKAHVKKKNKGLYAGVITGLDFSKVESGSFANAGFNVGFITGYSFSSKLSFETGLIANSKNYNSAGKDFDMHKIGAAMPSGMVINSVNSHSSLIEIPIKVKYNFIDKTNSGFFIAAGVSAYIMTREKNMYDAMVNGTQEKIMGIYDKDSYGLPAVANINIGYEHKISPLLNVRVEPFVKIPLKGMGVGSLPVTSAGLQIGITSRLK